MVLRKLGPSSLPGIPARLQGRWRPESGVSTQKSPSQLARQGLREVGPDLVKREFGGVGRASRFPILIHTTVLERILRCSHFPQFLSSSLAM